MKDFLTILLTMAAIAAFVWAYLKVILYLDLWFEKKFGWSLRGQRASRAEIQTLFHGNTKDQDQL